MMNFTEAKKREDYKFTTNYVGFYLPEIREGCFDSWNEYDEENGVFAHGVAVLEIGFADIELNIGAESSGDKYVNKIITDYYLCVKGGENGDEWSEAGYPGDSWPGYEVNVDWNADNWKDQLEQDMFNKLMKAAEQFGIKLDEPNWNDNADEFRLFDKINRR